jgi:hypothetical protein
LLSYGILSAGATIKISKQTWAPLTPPPIFHHLALYRDYGIFLSLIIILWAAYCAFHATLFSDKNVDEDFIVGSGMVLSGIFFALGTYVLIGGLAHLFPPV